MLFNVSGSTGYWLCVLANEAKLCFSLTFMNDSEYDQINECHVILLSLC